jgi:hypothetical protein
MKKFDEVIKLVSVKLVVCNQKWPVGGRFKCSLFVNEERKTTYIYITGLYIHNNKLLHSAY